MKTEPKRFSTRLSPPLEKKMDDIINKGGEPASYYVREALKEYISKRNPDVVLKPSVKK